MPSHRPLTRAIALTLSGILFCNPLLSTAAELAVDKNGSGNTSSVVSSQIQAGGNIDLESLGDMS